VAAAVGFGDALGCKSLKDNAFAESGKRAAIASKMRIFLM
jgi:hypothetical protein